jgi:hypothetical protein
LGKVLITKSSEVFDEKTNEGKRMLRIIDLNEMAFTKLVLSIDLSSSSGKLAFGNVKSCKTKDYEDGHAGLSWEKLKKKYDPVSAPSLFKTERLFRKCKLGNDEDPETWITNLEDLRLKLKVMGLFMTDDQFMVQILNSLTNDYELQMLLLERRIGSKENPLTIDELKEELSLKYERLLMKTETAKIDDLVEEKALVVTQFNCECQNRGKIGHETAQCKPKQKKEERNEVFCNYCKKSGYVKSNFFKLMKKKQVKENGNDTRNGVVGTVTDIVLSSVESEKEVDHEIWIGDSGASCQYCIDDEGLYEYKTISEEIMVGNGNAMIAKKVGKF